MLKREGLSLTFLIRSSMGAWSHCRHPLGGRIHLPVSLALSCQCVLLKFFLERVVMVVAISDADLSVFLSRDSQYLQEVTCSDSCCGFLLDN
jgi:hypothetical protein